GLRPKADGTPVAAGAETGEHDPLRRRKRLARLRIGQQLPPQMVELGRAAIDGELHPEEIAGALDGRLELAVLLTHVRLLVGDEALRGEEALRERKAVRVPRRVLELHEVEWIESGHGAERRPLGIVRGVE